MALDLKFSKSERSSNWGFRIVGGADFQEPLVVVKVHENSLAEKSGLHVEDIIVKINDIDTATLTHSEAHDLIASSGLQFTLKIKRREFVPPQLLQDEGKEVEVRDVQIFVDEDLINKAEEIVDILEKEIFTELGQHRTAVNKASEKKMVFSNSTQTYIPTEEKYKQKKWSTFLVKPDRPQPKLKKTIEQQKVEDNPYKIVITKQSRRKSLPKEKRVQFDQNIIELEMESLSSRNQDSPEIPISPDSDNLEYEQDADFLEDKKYNNDFENHYIVEKENFDEEQHNKENIDNEIETDFDNQIKKDFVDVKYKPISEIIIHDPNSQNVMTLEEQLKTVQKQLKALSLLPSEVKSTLDAVSKQLASIVSTQEEIEEFNEEVEENRDDALISVEALAEIDTNDADDSVVGDDLDNDSVTEEEIKEILRRANLEDKEKEEDLHVNLEEINNINEEKMEAQKREEELIAKKEKNMDDRPLKSSFRPIVLPGGRKWIDPDDVVPTRKPKMTDEKIMESIESSFEVIAGKRKGINFLKYTPPQKKMDHLQRSEVYRLIHGMEPPTKGITIRPEKVLPEQDYYEASRENP